MKPIISLLAVIVLTVPALADDKPAKPKAIRPVVVLTGSKSGVTKEAFKVATTEDEWDKVWTEHRLKFEDNKVGDKDQKLSVDFTQHMVLAIFHGESSTNSGIEVVEVVDGDSLTLRYHPAWYQTGGVYGEKPPDRSTASYCFVVLPRVEKTIVFEENVQHLIGGTPEWKRQATLPAPKGEKK